MVEEAKQEGVHSLRCAVFGVNGYLGSHVGQALLRQGHQVVGYDIQDQPEHALSGYTRLQIEQDSDWAKFDGDVDAIFFFSGLTGTHQSFDQGRQYVNVNEGGLLRLCETLRQRGRTPRIIFPSSRLVYKGSEQSLAEEAEKQTKTIYAVNKLACEGILQAYHVAFGIPYTVFRICVPYGAFVKSRRSYGTIGSFLQTAQGGRPIQLYGDGRQRRTVTHVADLCGQMLGLVVKAESVAEVFNIGGEAYAVREMAGRIADKYGVQVQCRDWPAADLRLESGSTVFDDSKAQRVQVYQRQYNFEQWVESL